ncbi:MAG: hypothetical protein J6Z11_01825 [Candidatus Riflebacteria bacterium]|nr:hypothetical protein [Candidatus Riflebacteria bacterium]
MKRNILILFAVLSLIISLTGCGSSGHSNSVAPTPTTMTTLRVSLTQNGQPATGADAALYTPAAAMREGLIQAQNNTTSRASIVSNTTEGVYKPTSTSADGTYTFTVPAGEYTLIANKGTLRAVVTDIRAEMAEEQESITVEDLTPTAIIYGKVTIDENFGIEPTAVIVYLENTSCVALADTNGNFIISGVPAKKTFTLAAMSNQNGKVYTTNGISVEVKEDLSFTPESLELTLAEKTSPTDKYQITGLVKDASSIGVKDVLVMATNTNKSLLYVATTNEQGKFSIITNSTGEFNITVIGASPESVTVNVDSNPFQITNPFIIGFTSAYGSIKGKINNDTNSTPDVGRYLVQLIGVDGTPYRTQTKSDYDQNIKESIFTFDNVYPGTYTVFVDPAGNGFIGSVGTFTVKPGKTTDLTQTATATVIFVQPTFTATATSEISITEDYPFVVDPLTNNVVASVTVKDLNNNSFINKKFELKKSTDNNIKYIIM